MPLSFRTELQLRGIGRAWVFIVGILAAISFPLHIYGHIQSGMEPTGLFAIMWEIARYFTILTNLIIAVYFTYAALKGHWPSYSFLTAITLWITIVGVVYHTVLAADHETSGILSLTNIIHHTIVPLGVVGIWMAMSRREEIPATHPFMWLFFPLLYGIYAIARGLFDGFYPYFYMDPGVVGWPGVAVSQVGFTVLFLGLGFIIRFVSNRLWRGEIL